MKKIKIAFDIDGTLRCNGGNALHGSGISGVCDEFCQESNQPIVSLAWILHKWFKNVEIHAWSGGGKDYAYQFVRTHGLSSVITEARCHSKIEKLPYKFDLAVDDQHGFELAEKNLIVRMK